MILRIYNELFLLIMATLKEIRSERRFVKYAVKGDKRSLERLITRYIDFCYSIAMIFLEDDRLSKKALENTLEKVYNEIENLYDPKGFRVWIYDLLKKEIATLKQKGTVVETGQNIDSNFNGNKINYYTLNKIVPEDVEESEVLLTVIRNLSEDQKELIVLIDFEGMTLSDAAILTDTSLQEVRQLLFLAKKNIIKGLAQYKVDNLPPDLRKEEIYDINQHGM